MSEAVLRLETADVLLPLLGDSRYKAIHGGRGSMKSHFFAELAVERCVMFPGTRIVCVREVQKSLRESAKRLIEDKIHKMGLVNHFRLMNDEIRTPGGGVILFQGMSDHTAESIKSLEGFDIAWVEEAQTLSSRSLEFLRPTIRKEGSQLWFSWNARSPSDPVDVFFRGLHPPKDAIVIGPLTYKDNPWFPGVLENDRQWDEVNNRDRYAHIWLGEYEPAVSGAIWKRQFFHRNRRENAPTMNRIVIAVDIAVTSGDNADEHGILACGLGEDKRGYVLKDYSTRGGPMDWANRVVSAYDEMEADAIVIETNQGGDMVKQTIKTVQDGLPIIEVRATKGKHVRAEPIASLYEQDRISHIGTFTELEDQFCLFTRAGYEGNASPDRADAAIWAFNELFPSMVEKKQEAPEHIYMPAIKTF